jgi:hypothetical protein
MTKTLYVSGDYDQTPQVYKNFYRAVVEPKLMSGIAKGNSLSSSVFLSDFNAHWDNPSKSIVFETEHDLTMFLLRWS